jgi:hypothetical protein|tara:strand:- start:1694 stop:2218 length:525 start_codon:yes stop_codon:yes gene_type:complete
MKTEALERYLNSFGKQVVNRAKGNLQKAKGGGTNLENSLSFKVITDADGFSVQFFMDSYGTFVDKGVSGTDVRRSFKDYKGKTISSPYKYTTKQPPSRVLDKWIVKKGIAPRDEKGRFMSRKSISFLIARSIKRKGIQGISFFQKPLMLGLKQFGKEMLGAVKDDIINGLTTVK